MNQTDFALVVDALSFAAHKHRDQRRKDRDASPYINHPIALMRVLALEAGLQDPLVLGAALLHDTVEDTETTPEELAERFGPAIRDLVLEVSDDKTLSKAERKHQQVLHAAGASEGAKLIKLADKICNLRDVVNNPPSGWDLARRREYFDWAARVIDQLRGTHPGLEAIFDQVLARRP
ncbi:HD domain-containing protein [Thiocystis violascens]|uniref:Metal dependent phosphohydrolase n=1 Tax=Thiocystis violascens (strain ATCC 17096 / DSM 198 / 6111) TaxID=765911 RepID=I3YCW0_THIV6|nr:HD domain-containing protein [Thiocystis violascens]AFL74828.1 metal dependent phosphohydrolase [Thiocystis violascens DSM 198]